MCEYVAYGECVYRSHIKARPWWKLYQLAHSMKETITSKEIWVYAGIFALVFYGPVLWLDGVVEKRDHAYNLALQNAVSSFSDHVALQSPQLQDAYSFILNTDNVSGLQQKMGATSMRQLPADRSIPMSLETFAACKNNIAQFAAPLESAANAYYVSEIPFNLSFIWSVFGTVLLLAYTVETIAQFFRQVKPDNRTDYAKVILPKQKSAPIADSTDSDSDYDVIDD